MCGANKFSREDAEAELAANKAAKAARKIPGLTAIERIRMAERARAKSTRASKKRKMEAQMEAQSRSLFAHGDKSTLRPHQPPSTFPSKPQFGDPSRVPRSVAKRRASLKSVARSPSVLPEDGGRQLPEPTKLKARFDDSQDKTPAPQQRAKKDEGSPAVARSSLLAAGGHVKAVSVLKQKKRHSSSRKKLDADSEMTKLQEKLA